MKMKVVWNWTTQKTDFFLVFLLSISLFLGDIAMNKVATFGIDYKANIAGIIKVPMILMMWVGGLFVVMLLSALIIRAVANRKEHLRYDIWAGIFGFISFSFLLLGGILQVVHIDKFPFFIWEMFTITAYHFIAILGLILTMIYFIITE